jgi:hypothetical protein
MSERKKRKDPFGDFMARAEAKARDYGYKTKREQAAFVAGYVSGYNRAMFGPPKDEAKRSKGRKP